MSTRYGIDLVLDPAFTAKAYQTRQIVCGQYASWAAEMQMLRMPLTPYFPCPEERLPILTAQAADLARETGGRESFVLRRAGIAGDAAINGVVVEFDAPAGLLELQGKAQAAGQSHSVGLYPAEGFWPRVGLLEYGSFPADLLGDVVAFAEGVAAGLAAPAEARPWRLLVTRYDSAAAGDDWSGGRWAGDLSWRVAAGYRVFG